MVGSNARENFDLQNPNKNMDRTAVEGWMTLDKAKALFTANDLDFEALKRQAATRAFKPVAFKSKANFGIKNSMREIKSRNIIASKPGSDPALKDEYIIYTAHWDHLGRDAKLSGDQIYNGALDNASGVAALLELAAEFKSPRRSVLFLSVTAEEKGLLGAKYYATHPLYPLRRTLANLNIDGLNPWGRTRDVNIIGNGNSSLEDLVHEQALAQGRAVTPDAEPEKGRFYRSDHFEFAKAGVPALYLKPGLDYRDQPPGYGKMKSDEYTARDYHKVSDEVKEGWDLSGAVEDIQLLFKVGSDVSERREYPQWKEGSEFKARRDAMLK